jgi:hypothetical protein
MRAAGPGRWLRPEKRAWRRAAPVCDLLELLAARRGNRNKI